METGNYCSQTNRLQQQNFYSMWFRFLFFQFIGFLHHLKSTCKFGEKQNSWECATDMVQIFQLICFQMQLVPRWGIWTLPGRAQDSASQKTKTRNSKLFHVSNTSHKALEAVSCREISDQGSWSVFWPKMRTSRTRKKYIYITTNNNFSFGLLFGACIHFSVLLA